MSSAPSTLLQAALLVLLVLPGIVYQFLRERFRPPARGHRDLGERVLRALVASILLDTVYLIVAGPALVRRWTLEQARPLALLGGLLLVVVPALAAGGLTWWDRRRSGYRGYRSDIPAAWDHAFAGRGGTFVRIRLTNGIWVGGWFGNDSFASSYPEPAEVFLESSYEMSSDGKFGARVRGSRGLYVAAANIQHIEFVDAPEDTDA